MVPFTAPHDLDLEVDRLALAEYQRVYRDRRGETDEGVDTVVCPTTQRTRDARLPDGDRQRSAPLETSAIHELWPIEPFLTTLYPSFGIVKAGVGFSGLITLDMRLGERFIARETISPQKRAVPYEIVEAYQEDKYFPSYLLLGREGDVAFHILFGVNAGRSECTNRHRILPQSR